VRAPSKDSHPARQNLGPTGKGRRHAAELRSAEAMADPAPAEKFLANWVSDYVEADRRDRAPLDASVERCLADADLVGIPRDEVVKAAGGDVSAHLKNALKAKRSLNAAQAVQKRTRSQPQ
jgi:hypothetical protein